MKIIAIANQKGGVGKTTTACNIAGGLAIRGLRVLLLDLDSQCNTTTTFFDTRNITTTLADVMVGTTERKRINEAIYETHLQNLDLVPSHIRLAMIDRQVQIEDQYRLKDALESIAPDYDYAIIDCPPSLGMTLTQALLASTHVLVPVAAQYYPLEGVLDLRQTVQATKRPNPSLSVLGYVMTQFDARNGICAEALSKMQEMFEGDVFDTIIRVNVKLQTAPAYRQTIYEHAPNSHGTADYECLIEEMLDRLGKHTSLKIVEG